LFVVLFVRVFYIITYFSGSEVRIGGIMLTSGHIPSWLQQPRTVYTTALALYAVTKMREKKITKKIHPYREKALNAMDKKIEDFLNTDSRCGFPKNLNKELLYLIEMDELVLSFTMIDNIVKDIHVPQKICDEVKKWATTVNKLYKHYVMALCIPIIPPFLKENLLYLHQEIHPLRMFDALYSGLQQVTDICKNIKHAAILDDIMAEGLSKKKSLDAKVAYEKLVTLTIAFRDLVCRDYEQSSLFSYTNNMLWNKSPTIISCLDKALEDAASLKPLNRSCLESKKTYESISSFKI
jgi:hypothetical protein